MRGLEYTARLTVSPDVTILPRIVGSRKAKAISTKRRLSATDPMLWDVGRKIRKGNGGFETNLLSLQIRRGSVSFPFCRRYDATPIEVAMIAVNATSMSGDTGTSKA